MRRRSGRQRATAELKKYQLGPLYTPPSLQGTVVLPGVWGGANWGGGAFDPATGRLYVKTTRSPGIFKMEPFNEDRRSRRIASTKSTRNTCSAAPRRSSTACRSSSRPTRNLVAIDLNRGEIAWKVPFGDAPEIRSLPALKDVPLPDRLGAVGPPGAIVTKSGLIFVGGNDMALSAFDTADGRELWRYVLPRQATATPMTYLAADGRQFVVIATGRGEDTVAGCAFVEALEQPDHDDRSLHQDRSHRDRRRARLPVRGDDRIPCRACAGAGRGRASRPARQDGDRGLGWRSDAGPLPTLPVAPEPLRVTTEQRAGTRRSRRDRRLGRNRRRGPQPRWTRARHAAVSAIDVRGNVRVRNAMACRARCIRDSNAAKRSRMTTADRSLRKAPAPTDDRRKQGQLHRSPSLTTSRDPGRRSGYRHAPAPTLDDQSPTKAIGTGIAPKPRG